MNTPDTEWEKKFDEEFVVHMNGEKYFKYVPTPTIIKDIKSFFAKLLSSRDAYWKERVGIAYEQGRYDEAQAFDKVMQTPITNEDNLK